MQTQIVSPAADPNHPSHWQLILAAILAGWQSAEPIIVHLLPPTGAAVMDVSTAIAPIVIQTIQTAAAGNPAH